MEDNLIAKSETESNFITDKNKFGFWITFDAYMLMKINLYLLNIFSQVIVYIYVISVAFCIVCVILNVQNISQTCSNIIIRINLKVLKTDCILTHRREMNKNVPTIARLELAYRVIVSSLNSKHDAQIKCDLFCVTRSKCAQTKPTDTL